MTDRRIKSNPEVPHLYTIIRPAVLGATAVAVYVWLYWGGPTTKESIGAMAWLWFGIYFLGEAITRTVKRGQIKVKALERMAAHTGVWKHEGAGTFTVRWDPDARRYFVQGWISEFYSIAHESEWPDLDVLAAMIETAEADGAVPEDDEATRSVRARLEVKGWDQVVSS